MSVGRCKNVAAVWIAVLCCFAGFGDGGWSFGNTPVAAVRVTGQSTVESTGERWEYENADRTVMEKEMKFFQTSLQKPEVGVGENRGARRLSGSLSEEAFDAFDESDKVITGTYEEASFAQQDALAGGQFAAAVDENQGQRKQAPQFAQEQGETSLPGDTEGEGGLSIWTLAYLVISLALLLSLGAGLATYSLLHKKGKRF